MFDAPGRVGSDGLGSVPGRDTSVMSQVPGINEMLVRSRKCESS